MTEKKL